MKKRIAILVAAMIILLSVSGCSKLVIQVPGGSLGAVSGGSQQAQPANTADTAAPQSEQAASEQAQPSETAPAEQPASQQAPSEQAPSQSSAAPSEPASRTQDTSSAPAEQTKPSTGSTLSASSPKADIVSYYVTAYNKIATDAKTMTRTYDYTKNYNNILEAGGNERIASLGQSLMGMFMKENTKEEAGDASSIPPVGVTTLSISPDVISSATCKDNGSTYEITLKSTGTDDNYEVDPQPGSGSAGVIGPILRTEDVTSAASMINFEGMHMWYATASVTATVEKSSGHITELKFDSPCVLHFDKVSAFVVINVSNCSVGLEFMQNWTITY